MNCSFPSIAVAAVGLLLVVVPAASQTLSISQTPAVEIKDAALSHVVAATRLANGTIVAGDDQSGTVTLYSTAGARIRSVGRRGRGPGEFQHLWWLAQCGTDSVFVWDFVLRRMTVLGSGGEYGRAYTMTHTAGPLGMLRVACSRAGHFAFQPIPRNNATGATASVLRGRAPVILADSRGGITRSLDEMPATEMVVLSGGAGPRPLGRTTSVALSSTGQVYIGTADSAFVSRYSHDGNALAGLRIDVADRRATQRHYDVAIDAIVGSIHMRSVADSVRARMKAIQMPAMLPPYRALLTDPEDLLWLVLSMPGDLDTRLRVVTAEGRHVADLRLPLPLDVHDVGRDYVLGVRHEDGGPRIVLYRLSRTS